jgi:D-alanyl-lipoteichoic acid acyltransferase DltB (MBOAT superfamily)
VVQAVILLFIFKYWNFFVGPIWFHAAQRLHWTHAFSPLRLASRHRPHPHRPKKFAIADLQAGYTHHLNVADIAVANRPILPLWLVAYGMTIYTDFSAYSDIAIGSARRAL